MILQLNSTIANNLKVVFVVKMVTLAEPGPERKPVPHWSNRK
jgi:hypothetical protein